MHAHQVAGEVIFTRQGIHAREMVDSLVRLHAVELVNLHGAIGPHDVPLITGNVRLVAVRSVAQAHFEDCTRHIPHYMVLGLRNVQH